MTPKTDPRDLRNLRRIGVVALLVLAVAFAWLQIQCEATRTVVFPDGTRVVLHRVTWGAAMERRRPGNFRSRIGEWIASERSVALHPVIPLPEVVTTRSSHPLRIEQLTHGFGTRLGPSFDNVLEPGHLETIVVHGARPGPFTVEALDHTGVPFETFVVTPNLPVALHRDEVRWADWRSPRLRFRIRGGGIEKIVELPNPRAPATLRHFREPAEPLPVVRRKGGVEMHLVGLRPVVSGDPESVAWVPEVRFRHKGRDVTQEMNWQHLFEDADGRVHSRRLLASEPKWRVRIQAWSKLGPDSETGDAVVLRLPRVPGEGEWVPLPDLERLRALGFVDGGFTGPGSVSVINGTPRGTGSAGETAFQGTLRSGITPDSWEVHSREDHTVLWLVLDTRGVERPPWGEATDEKSNWWGTYRTSDGVRAQGSAQRLDFLPDLQRRLFRVDLNHATAGDIRMQVRLSFAETFLVDAPTAPKSSGPGPTAAPAR